MVREERKTIQLNGKCLFHLVTLPLPDSENVHTSQNNPSYTHSNQATNTLIMAFTYLQENLKDV